MGTREGEIGSPPKNVADGVDYFVLLLLGSVSTALRGKGSAYKHFVYKEVYSMQGAGPPISQFELGERHIEKASTHVEGSGAWTYLNWRKDKGYFQQRECLGCS